MSPKLIGLAESQVTAHHAREPDSQQYLNHSLSLALRSFHEFFEDTLMKAISSLVIACALGACTTTDPNTTASTSRQIAWSASAEASRQVPGLGTVYGPPDALASFEKPFVSAEGRNHTVEACQNAIEREARRFGDVTVEIASRGPHQLRGDLIEGELDVRAVYRRLKDGEIRQVVRTSAVRCVMTLKGQVMDIRELADHADSSGPPRVSASDENV